MSDQRIRRLNRCFAGKDKATDVLSFPDQAEPWEKDENYAGDIVISVETADRQKRSTLENELKVLVLHGLLHLIGFDHEKDNGEMNQLESHLMEEFQLL